MRHVALARRDFLARLPTALAAVALLPTRVLARGTAARTGHPEPRPGIDASRVLPRERVPPHVAEVYERVRRVPRVVDGVRCHCGCADVPGFYSLLSCFEESGMAQHCDVCQGEADLVYTLHRQGRSLAEIRSAVDERYG